MWKMKAARDAFGEALLELGRQNPLIVALSDDLEDSTRAEYFKKEFPARFFNMGISEQDEVGTAVGLSKTGLIPFATGFSAFLTGRAYEFIRTSVCFNNANVKLIGAHAGITVGSDGATAQCLEDIAAMRVLPNMTVIVPCDAIETKKATFKIAAAPGPAYLRFGRTEYPVITSESDPFEIGRGNVLREGTDLAIIACGLMVSEALLAADQLASEGVSAAVINMHTIKPLDEALIEQYAARTRAIVTAEEHQINGGLGGAVCEALARGTPAPVEMVAVDDTFGESGEPGELLEKYGLKAADIVRAAKRALQRKEGKKPAKASLRELSALGQSVWLDNISRTIIEDGTLEDLISQGLTGLTSNPSIFDKALKESSYYDEEIERACSASEDSRQAYEALAVADVAAAADLFRGTWESTGGADGYVSLEASPAFAYDSERTEDEVKRLARRVSRPNVMYKIAATREGLTAIENCTAAGLNINVTLIFSAEHYRASAEAYLRGIKRYIRNGGDPRKVRSVASVFVSRIDTVVDGLLPASSPLRGEAALANAAAIYGEYRRLFNAEQFAGLRDKGVNVQRVLWGSTGTKDPAYSDIKYVSGLIAPDTVNTMPAATLEAFLNHGHCREALTPDKVRAAQRTLAALEGAGVRLDRVCAQLQSDGVRAFIKSYDSLLAGLDEKMNALCKVKA